MARKASILIVLAAALTIAPITDAVSKGKPRKREGTYNVTIGGYVNGYGTAVVSTKDVVFSLYITLDEEGQYETITVALPLSSNRFVGARDFKKANVRFDGRLDAPDDEKEKAIRGVRLVCRLRTPDNRFASIVGYGGDVANGPDDIDDRGRNKPAVK